MRKGLKKAVSIVVASSMAVACLSTAGSNAEVKAKQAGTLASEVTGTWSYWDGSGTVVKTNASLLEKLPTRANKDVTRWTTENYDNSTGPLDMGEWGTSFMWSYTADKWGNSTYALPMSYKACQEGIRLVKPSTVRIETAFLMEQPEDASLTDFVVGPEFKSESKKVDKVTDWSYDLEFKSDSSDAKMKTTLTQGSPFSFYEMSGDNKMKITRRRKLPSSIIHYNGTSLSDSTMLVFKVLDNADDAAGYSNYDYYAAYVPSGTTWSQGAGVEGFVDDKIGTLTATLPAKKTYMSVAWLMESKNSKDELAKSIASEYGKYAYNFITDTKAEFSYDKSTATVSTTYSYTVDKKAESTEDGTVMGILPHQYKNMSEYEYLDNTARTIRGTMKFLEGSSYTTQLKYTGILPSMMDIEDDDKSTLQAYVNNFMKDYGPTATSVTKEEYDINTYDTGKKLNRAVQAMEAAEACGDTESARALLNGIKAELADWFTADGQGDDKYFYYDKNIGSLFGFPQAYYTVDGMTDHHFHYGYFINAAAQVGLRDKNFLAVYKNIIDELVGDIATTTKNSTTARYPKLRYFSEYEGHSWASGHANFADGNNQESSSEAMNTWAGIILYGQATGNTELTNTGIYLYATEMSAINNYWFDIDEDVLDKNYRNGDLHSQASLVWGGKYGYETWWTREPLQVQGINILPMTAGAFYAAANKDFILKNYTTAMKNEQSYSENDKDVNRWNEIWSIYLAMADPEKALEHFNPNCAPEAGESKAHAFHAIKAFEKAGVPDLTVTSGEPLSAVFVKEDGERTYVVYNAEDNDKTVEFSDGTTIEAKAGKMTSVSDTQMEDKTLYKIEHYTEGDNGDYSINKTEKKSAKIGALVSAKPITINGYVYDENIEGTKASGTVIENEGLTLKLYYRKMTEDESSPWSDDNLYTKLGEYNGKDVSYFIIKDEFNITPKLLDANETFYIEYSGDYNAANTKGYMNGEETPDYVLGGVFKFRTSDLEDDSYTSLKLVSGNKKVCMIIKYGNPTKAFRTDDPDFMLEQETTQQSTTSQVTTQNITTNQVTTNQVTTDQITTNESGTTEQITTDNQQNTTQQITTKNSSSQVTTAPQGSEITSQTTKNNETKKDTKQITTKSKSTLKIKVGKTKIKNIKKKKTKIKISLKKIKKAKGYEIQFSKKKSFKNKNIVLKRKFIKKKTVTKARFSVKIKKVKKYVKLWARARAYVVVSGKRINGKWSGKKKIKLRR